MTMQTKERGRDARNSAIWLAGATGAAVAVATWAYSRRKPSYWDRTKRGFYDFADTATDQYRKASAGTNKAVSRTRKQAGPWLATCAKTTLMVLGALNEASQRKSVKTARSRAAKAADWLADAAAGFGRRVPQYLR